MAYLLIAAGLLYLLGRRIIKLQNTLTVLMYHHVTETDTRDNLAVTTKQLTHHFNHIIKNGYTTIFLSDLLKHVYGGIALPDKPLLLTFDDGYKNNFTLLYPLLQQYQLKANIFLIAGFIGRSDHEPGALENKYLNLSEIRQMSPDIIQFGLHTFEHKSYSDLSIPEIDQDITNCLYRLEECAIPIQPCLAYTYGAYPRRDPEKRRQMFGILQKHGILLAFRIGNRLNTFPLGNKYLLQRIDVKGNESFKKFKRVLKTGRKVI